jgi:uncharacterized protein (DUF427 family)
VSLTLGSVAPLGRPTGGSLNIDLPTAPAHLIFVHEVSPRLRGELAGVTVVDTLGARFLHETGLLPRWYVPKADVAVDLLEASPTVTHCPFKGDARYWNLRVGDQVVEDAFWEYPDPLPGVPDLTGLLAPYVERWGRWLEEDEAVVGHPRDPFHRVDILRSSRRVTVRANGMVVARSTRALAVNETGFPTRWYLPVDDIATAALSATSTSTVCPYKGVASYWSVTVDGVGFPDAVWASEDPVAPAMALKGARSFLGDGIDVEVT